MIEENDETLFPLERRLKDDTMGADRDALVEQLQGCTRAVKRKMDSGVAPKEFSELETLQKALEAGVRVVTLLWRKHHPA